MSITPLPETIRCGSCRDGPFICSVLEITHDHDRVIEGYYFCGWCFEFTDSEELRRRAKDMDAERLPAVE
jgi:hypothetical protein